MDFAALYTKTDGRISRKTWWIGALILGVANLVVSLLILPLLGFGAPDMQRIMAAANDPVAASALISSSMQVSGWAGLAVLIVFAYPIYALSVKRRHDKNNNGIDVIVYLVLTAVLLLVQALGLGFTNVEIQGILIPTPTMVLSVVGFLAGVFAIYMLIVLGFLKGTNGENDYGPDPLTLPSA